MPAKNRDGEIIAHIAHWCDQIDAAHADFKHDKETFDRSTTYQNAVAMCILQIGELVNRLSDEYKAAHHEIPWSKIRGMRNYVAHEYGAIDLDVVWYVANESVAELKAFCEQYAM